MYLLSIILLYIYIENIRLFVLYLYKIKFCTNFVHSRLIMNMMMHSKEYIPYSTERLQKYC